MKTFLKINDKQSVKLKSDTIKFKNHFKQLAVPFKTYVDFESILKWIKRNNRKIIFFAVLVTKLYVLITDLTSQLFFAEEKVQSINSLKQFLRSIVIANK